MCERRDLSRGFSGRGTRHMERSKNYQGRQGLGCKTTLSSTSRTHTGANRGGGGGPGGHGHRRSGHRGAELGHQTDRGGEGELDGGLTSAEDNGSGAESLVNGRGAIWSSGGAGSACGRRRTVQQGVRGWRLRRRAAGVARG
jgi:hypothetical protein